MEQKRGERQHPLLCRGAGQNFPPGVEAADILVLVITLIVADKRMVARNMLMLVGELLTKGPQNQFQRQIKSQFGKLATKNQAVGGFVEKGTGRMNDDLANEKRGKKTNQQVASAHQPGHPPVQAQQNGHGQRGPRVGAGKGAHGCVALDDFTPDFIVAAGLR
jgi:hypothetical protein